MPDALAAHRREVVYASGVAELAGAAGVLHPRTSRAAGWWLIATLVAIFPANVHMAIHPERYRGIPRWALLARLPLQGVCIAWVHRTAAAAGEPTPGRRLSTGFPPGRPQPPGKPVGR